MQHAFTAPDARVSAAASTPRVTTPPATSHCKRVGDFVLGECIGKGTFASVYIGMNTKTGEKVAIKVCTKDDFMKRNMLTDVNNELASLQRVKSRFIANLHDVMQTPRHLYMVLDLCDKTLFSEITSSPLGRLDEETARKRFQDILLGIHACHAAGVVHRDVKPENLLLTSKGRVKLGDFGFARRIDRLKDASVGAGTRQYLAPEAFVEKSKQASSMNLYAADMWSAGVVLYAMVVGRLPYSDQEISMWSSEQYPTPAYPKWLSAECKDVLQSLLNPIPSERIAMPALLAKPWFKFDPKDIDTVNEEIKTIYRTHGVLRTEYMQSATIIKKSQSIREALSSKSRKLHANFQRLRQQLRSTRN